ncbi:unnamed protein product [Cylindrotheca closterium]|uniref:FAD-binding PCMH-type domain-containing protein n=1 Tax=Cylindrotheca closterium TaxID=2856 RepID=A0AAD2JN17_9STRA|nr:unnamed protein product [Cylindrotheca closterium]
MASSSLSSQSAAHETDSLLETPQTDNLLRNSSNQRRNPYGIILSAFLLAMMALVALFFFNILPYKPPNTDIVGSQLLQLSLHMQGRVVFPEDADFGDASKVWREDVVANNPPLAIIEAFSESDVQLAMPVLARLFRLHDIPFRIRSGGHNKAGFSTTGGGIILSLKQMRNVELLKNNDYDSNELQGDILTPHPTTKTVVASVQPGATVEVVLDNLLEQEGAGGTVGICGNVAEGGFVLGGGIGFMSRSLGLGIDNVLSFRIVLYDGTIVTANAESHPDLFFALRGAGSGNYGVVTEMEYKYFHPMPREQRSRMVIIPIEDFASFLYNLGKSPPSREFMSIFGVSPDSATALMSWFSADPERIDESEDRFQEEIAPLLPASSYEQVPYAYFDWADGTHDFSDKPGYTDHLYAVQVWQGFLMPANNTRAVWDEIVSLIQHIVEECPDVHPDIELWGGAISDTPHNETAFAYRDALFNVGVQLYVTKEAYKEQFEYELNKVNQWWPSVAQYLEGAYVNYPMNSLGDDEYPRLYWGNHLERLVHVKRQYDPLNIFRYEQSMPVAVT